MAKRNRGSHRRNRRRGARSRFVKKWEVNGSKQRALPDPKPIVYTPWNSTTLEFYTIAPGNNAPIVLTAQSIASRINTQLGIIYTNENQIEGKLLSIRAWNLTGGSITMDVADLIQVETTDQAVQTAPLITLRDFAGRNHWASIGYSWPKAHSSVPFLIPRTSNNPIFVLFKDVPEGQQVLVRLNLLWRKHATADDAPEVVDINSAIAENSLLVTNSTVPVQLPFRSLQRNEVVTRSDIGEVLTDISCVEVVQ